MKKWIGIIIGIIIVVAVITGVITTSLMKKNKKTDQNADTIVKENVNVIDEKVEDRISEVTEDTIVFNKNPKYKDGDVLVAGIIDQAENGFIRRVVKTEKKNKKYIVTTEPALLTDVFEKATIKKKIRLTENGVEEYKVIKQAAVDMGIKIEDFEDYDFGKMIEVDPTEHLTATAGAGFSIWVETNIDINHGHITCSIIAHNECDGKIVVEYKEGWSSDDNIAYTLLEKNLPNYEFTVSGIPIVVTNKFESKFEPSASIEGSLKFEFEAKSENALGFKYDSKTKKVEQVVENKPFTDGLDWNLTSKIAGEAEGDISLHLITKLYDCTGADIAYALCGKAEGEVKATLKADLGGYAGKLDLSIGPKLQGTLVVTVPIIDKTLVEQPLFEKELKPYWSDSWESSKEGKKDLEYQATGEQNEGILQKVYKTRFEEVNMVTCPTFQFDIPMGWDIDAEVVNTGMDVIEENVTLVNSRGVTVSYWDCLDSLGAAGRVMARSEVTKVDDSEFVPSYPAGTNKDMSSLGIFIVAKIKTKEQLYMDTDQDFHAVDGETFYAVVPESYVGEKEYVDQAGHIDEFSFDYPTPHAFIATSPDGTFTDKEEQDVIRILKSFKVAE